MSISVYILISLIGLLITHIISNQYMYSAKYNRTYFVRYILSLALFGEPHYSLAFNDEFSLIWSAFFELEAPITNESFGDLGFLFFVLTIMTAPPSQFNRLEPVELYLRNKIKKLFKL
ncbi:hypothetical protein ACNO5M_26515 [Vibrio owensii]|uniref:hypothetical protein n=1 Tax=Vibrio owensii TaxID=696485 RepID=UPI003AAC77C4